MSKLKKIITIILILFCLGYFYTYLFNAKNHVEEIVENANISEDKELLKYIDNKIEEAEISQNKQFICSLGFTTLTFFISLYFQYKENKTANTYKIMEELPRTIEEINILITILLSNNSYKKMIDTIDSKILSEFDRNEIQEIFEYDNKAKTNIFNQIEKIVKRDKMQEKYDKYLKENFREEKYKVIYPMKFTKFIEDTLDKMNFLCENIIKTNPKNIYEQYNTIFLSSIRKLSIIIAKDNKNAIDKKYTNIIKLYKKWLRRKNIKIYIHNLKYSIWK